jgi:hypothetical protein
MTANNIMYSLHAAPESGPVHAKREQRKLKYRRRGWTVLDSVVALDRGRPAVSFDGDWCAKPERAAEGMD